MRKGLAFLKPIFRKKTTIFTFVLIGIVMSLTIILKTYYDTSYNGYYGDIREYPSLNTYWVTKLNSENIPIVDFKNQVRKELEETEHVIGVFPNLTWRNGGIINDFKKKNKIDGRITLAIANNKTLPEIVYGSNFPEDDSNDYLICPKNFIPNGSRLEKYSRFDMINLKKYINKNITLTYPNFATGQENLELSLKLVGIYKNSSVIDDENICYVKESTLYKMYLAQNGLSTVIENPEASTFYVEVDQYQNREMVKEQLKKLDYNVSDITFRDYAGFDKIASNISKTNTILNCAIFLLIFLVLLKQFFDQRKYYDLLYFLGYTKRHICLINIFSNLILIIFSSIVTFILALFMKNILNFVIYLKPLIFSKSELIMNYSSLGYVIPLALITSLIVSILGCIKISMDEVNLK